VRSFSTTLELYQEKLVKFRVYARPKSTKKLFFTPEDVSIFEVEERPMY